MKAETNQNLIGTTAYNLCVVFLLIFLFPGKIAAQFKQVDHKPLSGSEIGVDKPGSFDVAGATYKLVNDISSPRSAIFLGKDVTLDLNGYSVTFADAGYEHVPNYSFEDGLKDWDFSKAKSAKIEDTKVHVFVGDKILRLSEGEEIVSQYINLPVANRSYIAMCGVAKLDMMVSVYVENEQGESVVCNTAYRDGVKQSCPVEKRSPRLGGGFVFAHLNGLKAGKYRIRVKAETDCLVDCIDIRPGMDVGIGIVEKTDAIGHNDHFYEREHSAFFDYTADAALSEPVAEIPEITGKGTITIKNGIIKNATQGAISWGIQSTAEDVMVVLENVKILNSGINATAADLLQGTITKCTFDVNNPFIINRHGSEFYAVDLRGEQPSEVSFCDFYGGQGCLAFKGNYSKVHHNFFENRQTVTNHYSIMAMGDSSLVFSNLIKPETGSGIEVYVHRGVEIFNNEIHIEAAPPTSEYGHEEYSVDAVRIADYNAKPGSPEGCFGNKVYNNKIFITGKDYPDYPDYTPMAWAVFYSASGGDNYIFSNEIQVEDKTPGMKNETSAFYIGGGTIGGQFFNNRITSNVYAMWVACRYGGDENTKIFGNTIIKSPLTITDFKPIRMGWAERDDCVARDIQFRSNNFEGIDFDINSTSQAHSYSVWWTLKVKVTDKKGNSLKGVEVRIHDKNGNDVFRKLTDSLGIIKTELKEYSVNDKEKSPVSPFTIIVGEKKEKINLNKNQEIEITI
ncbi:MAG TPA: hypothetical protein PLC80_02320 [Draconibacterium sp.]|nr:hypothetical protein [Draconibacterium sp.]